MATPQLSGTQTIRDKAIDYLADKTEKEQLHKDLVNLTHQFQLTQSVLKNNNKQLQEQAKTDKSIAKMLKTSDKGILQEVSDKILNREDVSNEDASEFVNSMEQIVTTLGSLSGDFKLSVSDLAGSVKNFVIDERTNNEDRNKFLDTFIKQNNNEELNVQLQSLKGEEVDQNIDKIVEVLEAYSNTNNQSDDLMFDNMKELNDSIDDLVVTQEEFNEKVDKGGVLSKFKEKAGSIAQGAKTKVGLALDAIAGVTALAVILLPIIIPMVIKFLKSDIISQITKATTDAMGKAGDTEKTGGGRSFKAGKGASKSFGDMLFGTETDKEREARWKNTNINSGKRQQEEYQKLLKKEASGEGGLDLFKEHTDNIIKNTPSIINNVTNISKPQSNSKGSTQTKVGRNYIDGVNLRHNNDPKGST